VTAVLKELSERYFQQCFGTWQRFLNDDVKSEGGHMEVDHTHTDFVR
jgi:hypothetical protein